MNHKGMKYKSNGRKLYTLSIKEQRDYTSYNIPLIPSLFNLIDVIIQQHNKGSFKQAVDLVNLHNQYYNEKKAYNIELIPTLYKDFIKITNNYMSDNNELTPTNNIKDTFLSIFECNENTPINRIVEFVPKYGNIKNDIFTIDKLSVVVNDYSNWLKLNDENIWFNEYLQSLGIRGYNSLYNKIRQTPIVKDLWTEIEQQQELKLVKLGLFDKKYKTNSGMVKFMLTNKFGYTEKVETTNIDGTKFVFDEDSEDIQEIQEIIEDDENENLFD